MASSEVYGSTGNTPATTSKLRELAKEYWVEAAAAAGMIALTAGIIVAAKHDSQTGSIKSSLTTEATDHIPGATDVAIDGTMFNFSVGSLHGATVTLSSGADCNIQFTTESGNSIWSKVTPDHAKIVSYGTCPTDIPVVDVPPAQ